MTRQYRDEFTLDGRLKVVNGVSKNKVSKVAELLEKREQGSMLAEATLAEALSTSDAIFNFAHLASINFVPEYDEADRVWTEVATRRTVSDFKPATLYSLKREWTNGNDESGVVTGKGAPVVPEGTAYPYAYISGEQSTGAGIKKHGFKTDWTFESRVNDGLGALDELPDEMRSVALDTEEDSVFGALTTQITPASTLDGGAIPDGTTVAPNAVISRQAIVRAVIELSERKVNGRKIQVNGRGYNLVVPVGQAEFVKFYLNQTYAQIVEGGGAIELNVNGYNPLANIGVVESEYVTGTEWYLLPKPGATRRPVLDKLDLRGYVTPQLFVDNHTGVLLGSSSVAPFEGSFDADVITLKLRQFTGGVLWQPEAVVYSNGTGVA